MENGIGSQGARAAGGTCGAQTLGQGRRPGDRSFLDCLPPGVRTELAAELRHMTLAAGQELFCQGERGDQLFILLSGRLRASVRDPSDGREREVGSITAGEPVGEMALLSGRPRSATVIAVRDSELAILDRPGFMRLVTQCPAAIQCLTGVLADRLERMARGEGVAPRSRTVALIPLTEKVPMTAVLAALAPGPSARGRQTVLDRTSAERGLDWFHRIEQAHQTVIYVGDVPWGSWARFCLRQADHVLLLTAAATGSMPTSPGTDLLRHPPPGQRCDLVVLRDNDDSWPAPELEPGLVGLPAEIRWNLRLDRETDRARLRRIVERRAIGLVMSGGGARGFCHVGVIRALSETGIPLDIVGGTSMGALVAATYAMGWSHDEIRARLRACFIAANPVNDYTLPVLALTRGAKLSRLLHENFGETAIEQLVRPFFALAASLTTGREVVMRQGSLRHALRATLAIPGLLPPAVEAGEALADGGLINNLPVDVLHKLGRGPIIATDVGTSEAFTLPKDGLESGGLQRWWRYGREPGIATILLRAATLSSAMQASLTRELADVVLSPPAERIGLLEWRALERAIGIGYDYTRAQIEAGALTDLKNE